jgi:hypothetical protein
MLRTLYIDCLALLQGLLGRFGSGPISSSFDPQLVDRLIEENLNRIAAILTIPENADTTSPDYKRSVAEIEMLSAFLIDTMRINKETALDLYAECISPKKAFTPQAAYLFADTFLNVLISQYKYIRYPQEQPIVIGQTG